MSDDLYKNLRYTNKGITHDGIDFESDAWQKALDEYSNLLLTGLGTFCTKDCVSAEDLCKLLDNPTDWKQWITSQIEQEGVEKYKEWYGRMLQRGTICEELMKANDELFKGEK